MGSKEALKQAVLQRLESRIIEYYKSKGNNVAYGNQSRGLIGQRETLDMGKNFGRNQKKDGFYVYTVDEGNESHGIIIEKRTKINGTTDFLLFDPNGKSWVNRLKPGILKNKKDKGGYYINIRFNGEVRELDMENTPDKAWNSSGECCLWNIVMLVLFMEKRYDVPYILDFLSYRYPRDEYNSYKNKNISTRGDVFIIQFAEDFFKDSTKYSNDISKFIELSILSMNVYLRTPYSLDYEDIKNTIYTRSMLEKLSKKELVIICKTRNFKGYNTLCVEDLIYNIIDTDSHQTITLQT
jgi:hypothetical protein